MKKLIYLPVCLGMLFFSAACENWFDVSPKSDVKAEDLFQQESGFRDVLTGVYSLMSAPESYGRQLSFGYVDVLAQYYNISGNTHRYIKTKDYLYREPYDKEVLSTIWSRQYKGIANLNAMLMFIDEQRGVFSGDEVYRIYKGEILALRGMLHFDMLRLFSASPAIDKERKAIPYLESYTNLPQHQLTVGAVLEKVVKDLNAARELMREVDPYGPNYAKLESLYRNHPLLRNRQKHLNYYAVTALLARVQLYAGNLPDALEAAREIVGEPGSEPVAPFSLTTAAVTDERLFDSELLFALEEGKMQDNIDVYFGESVIKNGITNSSTALSISINNRNKLFAQQDPADDDYRLKLWFQETNSATAVMPGKYVNVGCIPLIRLSELYYIAAECSANQGLAYLNTLRAHRGLAAMTEVTDLQAEIAKEYSKEFMCEGQMFYYYKRLGLKRIGVYRTVAIEPEEVYVIPLPDDELDFGLRWVLSIPFFISCIRQQNPLTVLSKIILRKVKQFNLPPQKKMRDFCIFEDTPRLFLLGNRQFTFIAHNLDVAEDVVGQICHRHIRLCPYNPYCPDNKAVHTLLFKTEYVLDKATGLGLAPVLSLLFFCQRMIPTAFLADYRIHAMLLHG